MDQLIDLHDRLNALVWGPPMLALLFGTGVLLTLVTRGVQFRKLGFVFREVLGKLFQRGGGEGSVRPFQALATALASTVGVGNIAGVSTAIFLGGPGALFWLWLSGIVGMATKFSEIAVALHYRERTPDGNMRGGAMYVLSKGIHVPWLGTLFALFVAAAALGSGNMVQANSVAHAAQTSFGISPWVTGGVLAGATALVILGGLKRIVQLTEVLVPFMCLLYVGGAIFILVRYAAQIPGTLAVVISAAFEGQAAVGGFAGAGVASAARFGIARGMFSNEAGLGSAPMVHSSAVTDHPIRQACYGIFEVLVDTLLVCFSTGMVVLVTGAWQAGETGAAMAAQGFQTGLPGVWGDAVVSISLILFAFSTLVGWAFYGETGAVYLFGPGVLLPYRLVWIACVYVGAVGSLPLIWELADTLNGLMAIPNLVAVLGSVALLRRLLREFFDGPGR